MDETKVIVEKGHGYWDMKLYPWGGCFKRFEDTFELKITEVYSTYKDGSPRQAESIHPITGNKIGIAL